MAGGQNLSGNNFLEIPSGVRDDEEGSVLTFCWMDHERGCTGGCEAFDPLHADDETGTWTSCRLINIMHAVGGALSGFLRSQTPSKPSIPGQDIPPPGV